MQKVVLENFKVGLFKQLISRSLMTTGTINVTFRKDEIESTATSSNDSLVKNWKYPSKDLYTAKGLENEVHLSIINGGFFKNIILGTFPDVCTIEFSVNPADNGVVDIVITGHNVSVKSKGASLKISFQSLSTDQKSTMFDESKSVASFLLSAEKINQIMNLSKINVSAENPVNYVQFEAANGKLVAKDTSFDLILNEAYNGTEFSVKLNKGLLNQIDREDHTVHLIKGDAVDSLILTSLATDIQSKILAILMLSVDDQSQGGDEFYAGNMDLGSNEGWD